MRTNSGDDNCGYISQRNKRVGTDAYIPNTFVPVTAICSHLYTKPLQSYENERHYEPGEDALSTTWYGLTYDSRRWKQHSQEARKDAFRRRNPTAHMKQAVQDNEIFLSSWDNHNGRWTYW
ncbi:unnamed protein product [Cylicocyclus nassatus]|uniref:Uncharacterized protein n=1 Tax=Cylicocyclus nassatus TaxID=53992 RepID=A0AA36H353_CYLNA|nr:unnamed protein product [Cylicocyclus nassatus]